MLSPFHPLQLTLGLVIWALYFVVLYAGLSISCQHFAPPEQSGAFNWVNIALLLLTFAVTLGLLFQARRGWHIIKLTKKTRPATPDHKQSASVPTTPQFINYVAVSIYVVAAMATLINGLPLVLLVPCI
ncbi:hypothetical protein [uncultured Gilvimarinus sp.]|uniref:hypothetical protein n=1 Tax=uncultured Gilvimarinus sp. TaxID=1689143 RepID=UPI0030D9AC0B